MLIILRPGYGVFSWAALLPFASALLFALYSVLTRLTTRDEPTFPAFFWPGVIGAVLMTVLGLPWLEPVSPQDSLFLAIAYLQIVFVTLIGLTVYGEVLELPVAFGAGIIIAAGLYALSLERRPA